MVNIFPQVGRHKHNDELGLSVMAHTDSELAKQAKASQIMAVYVYNTLGSWE